MKSNARRSGSPVPLSFMKTGEPCQVFSVQGPPEVSRRLTNLGFTAGAPVTVVGKAGSALIVCIRDCRVALDGAIACCIRVNETTEQIMGGKQ